MSLAADKAVRKLCIRAGNVIFLLVDLSFEMGKGVYSVT